MEEFEERIGLQCLREALGYSGTEFGKMFQVDKTTVSKWENEKQKIPQSQLFQIANTFNCPVNYLVSHLSEDEEDVIRRIAFDYLKKKDDNDLFGDYSNNESNGKKRVKKIEQILLQDVDFFEGSLLSKVERLKKIVDTVNGEKVVDILLEAGELYVGLKGQHLKRKKKAEMDRDELQKYQLVELISKALALID